MDLNFTSEELAFREKIRGWVAENLPKDISHKVHNALRLSRDDMQRWAKILGKQGWLGWGWPKEFGGPGWNAVQRHLFEEECALAGSPRIVPFGPVMVAPVIMAFGTPEQQKRFLPGIASGEVWWSQGYSEPGSGSDLASLKTQGRAARRLLPRQRAEDLDHARPVWRMDLLPGPHQQRRQAADRHQFPADRHEEPRHHGAADHHDGRRARGQRGLVRQRRGAGRQPDRRREQGLDLREAPARARAHQHRRRQPREARARTAEADREGRGRLRRRPLPRRDREARGRHRRARDDGAARAVGREERQAEPRRRRPAEDPRQRDPAALLRADDARGRPRHACPIVREAMEAGWQGDLAGSTIVAPLAGTYFNMRKTTIYGGSNEVQRNIVAQTVLG